MNKTQFLNQYSVTSEAVSTLGDGKAKLAETPLTQSFVARNVTIKPDSVQMEIEVDGRWQPIRLAIKGGQQQANLPQAIVTLDTSGQMMTIQSPQQSLQVKAADELLSLLNLLKGNQAMPQNISQAHVSLKPPQIELPKLGIKLAINPSLAALLHDEPKLIASLVAKSQTVTLKLANRFGDELLSTPISKEKLANALASQTNKALVKITPLSQQVKFSEFSPAFELKKATLKQDVAAVAPPSWQAAKLTSKQNHLEVKTHKVEHAIALKNPAKDKFAHTPVLLNSTEKPALEKSNLHYSKPLPEIRFSDIKQAVKTALNSIIKAPFFNAIQVQHGQLKQVGTTPLQQTQAAIPQLHPKQLVLPQASNLDKAPLVQIFSQIKHILTPTPLNQNAEKSVQVPVQNKIKPTMQNDGQSSKQKTLSTPSGDSARSVNVRAEATNQSSAKADISPAASTQLNQSSVQAKHTLPIESNLLHKQALQNNKSDANLKSQVPIPADAHFAPRTTGKGLSNVTLGQAQQTEVPAPPTQGATPNKSVSEQAVPQVKKQQILNDIQPEKFLSTEKGKTEISSLDNTKTTAKPQTTTSVQVNTLRKAIPDAGLLLKHLQQNAPETAYQPKHPIERVLLQKMLDLPSAIKGESTSVKQPLDTPLLNKLSQFKQEGTPDLNRLVQQAFSRMLDEQNVSVQKVASELAMSAPNITPPAILNAQPAISFMNNVEKLLVTLLAAPRLFQNSQSDSESGQKFEALLNTLQTGFKAVNPKQMAQQLPSINSPLLNELVQAQNSIQTQAISPPIAATKQDSEAQLLMSLFLPMKLPDDTQQTHLQVGKYKKPAKANMPEKTVWYIRLNFDYANAGKLTAQAELMDKALDCQLTGNTAKVCALAQPHLDALRRKLSAHGLQVNEIELVVDAQHSETFFNQHAIVNIHI